MRALVLTLALLAGIKIWAQDSVYRSATEHALISAYSERAASTCISALQRSGGDPLAAASMGWEGPARLVIGNSHLSVYPWEFEHELWTARYRTAYLVLSARDGTDCAYDLAAGTAEVHRS